MLRFSFPAALAKIHFAASLDLARMTAGRLTSSGASHTDSRSLHYKRESKFLLSELSCALKVWKFSGCVLIYHL